jgi:hypothetical protein
MRERMVLTLLYNPHLSIGLRDELKACMTAEEHTAYECMEEMDAVLGEVKVDERDRAARAFIKLWWSLCPQPTLDDAMARRLSLYVSRHPKEGVDILQHAVHLMTQEPQLVPYAQIVRAWLHEQQEKDMWEQLGEL